MFPPERFVRSKVSASCASKVTLAQFSSSVLVPFEVAVEFSVKLSPLSVIAMLLGGFVEIETVSASSRPMVTDSSVLSISLKVKAPSISSGSPVA